MNKPSILVTWPLDNMKNCPYTNEQFAGEIDITTEIPPKVEIDGSTYVIASNMPKTVRTFRLYLVELSDEDALKVTKAIERKKLGQLNNEHK